MKINILYTKTKQTILKSKNIDGREYIILSVSVKGFFFGKVKVENPSLL